MKELTLSKRSIKLLWHFFSKPHVDMVFSAGKRINGNMSAEKKDLQTALEQDAHIFAEIIGYKIKIPELIKAYWKQ